MSLYVLKPKTENKSITQDHMIGTGKNLRAVYKLKKINNQNHQSFLYLVRKLGKGYLKQFSLPFVFTPSEKKAAGLLVVMLCYRKLAQSMKDENIIIFFTVFLIKSKNVIKKLFFFFISDLLFLYKMRHSCISFSYLITFSRRTV